MFRFLSSWRRRTPTPYPAFLKGAPEDRSASLDDMALAYHRRAPAGKMSTQPTKELETQLDLSLAYSPGVAAPCRAIAADPDAAGSYTNRNNLVAVVTNGTAVLGLGNIGPLAAKPVMEGKAALFHRFAGVHAVDIGISEPDPHKLAEIIIALEPSFGGINLEDIKAPDCFVVEEICRREMNVPVFHDDQHGTAVCVVAALENALIVSGRKMKDIKLVCSGAGAAALATLELLFISGLPRQNVIVFDSAGVIYKGRKRGMTPQKEAVATKSRVRTMEQALKGADVFLGLSSAGVLHPAWIKQMARTPIVLALANPDPEVWPDHARGAVPDVIIGTGRSDFPNQVNNVLCFPYLFRGALDAGAKHVTSEMLVAAADAIADIARLPPTEEVEALYPDEDLTFGPESLLPKPFDRRLFEHVPPAVAAAVR